MQEKHMYGPQNNFPLETESVMGQKANDILPNKVEPAKVMVIPRVSESSPQCQSSTLLTGINHDKAINRLQSDNGPGHTSTSLTTTCDTESSQPLNSKATNEQQRMSDISMALTPNYAYKRMQHLSDKDEQVDNKKTSNRRRNLPVSSPRQWTVEHSYDYPQLYFVAGRWQGKRKSNASSNVCDSITTVTNTSYSVGTK